MKIYDTAIHNIRVAVRYILRPVRPFLDDFLYNVPGVIHIGASDGQERNTYQKHDINVIWIEAIPIIFEKLNNNISLYPKQTAINAVLSDTDKKIVTLNISSNNGESSSILQPLNHIVNRPDITFSDTISSESISLDTLIKIKNIDIKKFPALIIDVQGAELLVLKGAINALKYIKYIKAEASEEELYQGCCTPEELTSFLKRHGFKVQRKVTIDTNSSGKRIYDIVYRR